MSFTSLNINKTLDLFAPIKKQISVTAQTIANETISSTPLKKLNVSDTVQFTQTKNSLLTKGKDLNSAPTFSVNCPVEVKNNTLTAKVPQDNTLIVSHTATNIESKKTDSGLNLQEIALSTKEQNNVSYTNLEVVDNPLQSIKNREERIKTEMELSMRRNAREPFEKLKQNIFEEYFKQPIKKSHTPEEIEAAKYRYNAYSDTLLDQDIEIGRLICKNEEQHRNIYNLKNNISTTVYSETEYPRNISTFSYGALKTDVPPKYIVTNDLK